MKVRSCSSKILALLCAASFSILALADDLARLEGKWTCQRKKSNGDLVTQVLEIKGAKFKYQQKSADGVARIFAEGDVKTEKLGPFSVAKFFNIKGGETSTDLQSTDDDHTLVYTLDFDKLRMAAGFDKERDDDEPRVDVYAKSAVK